MKPDKYSSFTHTNSTIKAANWAQDMIMSGIPVQVLRLQSGEWVLKAQTSNHSKARELWEAAA